MSWSTFLCYLCYLLDTSHAGGDAIDGANADVARVVGGIRAVGGTAGRNVLDAAKDGGGNSTRLEVRDIDSLAHVTEDGGTDRGERAQARNPRGTAQIRIENGGLDGSNVDVDSVGLSIAGRDRGHLYDVVRKKFSETGEEWIPPTKQVLVVLA